jgi:IS1 family transposase
MVSMNRLSTADRVRVIAALVEGNSIRATVRMTGVAKNTVVKLLADLGTACAAYHDEHVRGLSTERIQCDEIWSFVYAKNKNVPAEMRSQFGVGDVWTWTAIDADSKLVASYMIGERDAGAAREFMNDVASRMANRVQVTTDGHSSYVYAVGDAFKWDVDYTMLVKIYGPDRSGNVGRYSPPVCIGTKTHPICGSPDPEHVSTSFVERQNLTMRMGMRRFTRLTNAFSKKVENHYHAISLHFMHYNFCRKHQTIKQTPAQAAGLTDHAWSIEELVSLLEQPVSN